MCSSDLVSVIGSSVAREADDVLYTNAGPEIAVASTKAYVTQVACMLLFAMYLGRLTQQLDDAYFAKLAKDLLNVPDLAAAILKAQPALKNLALEHFKMEDAYFIGRGLDYDTCLEILTYGQTVPEQAVAQEMTFDHDGGPYLRQVTTI